MALVDAAPKGVLFGGKANATVNAMWGIDTSVMSAMEEAWEGTGEAEGVVPLFGDFEEKKLEEGVRKKLERVKNVVVRELKYKSQDVTLKDAAVSIPCYSMLVNLL